MPYAEVNGVKLWYEIKGKGEPIAQIHGAGFGHDNFGMVSPILAKKFQLLDYDMRGYGLSDRPIQEYSMEVWADDLAALMDHIGWDSAHIHGTSMGGMIAQEFAIKYPEKTRTLIIGCSACKCDETVKLTFRTWKRIAQTLGMGEEALAGILATQALSRAFLDSPKGPETVKLIQEVMEKNNRVEVFSSACDAMIRFDSTKQLKKIKAPTLIMAGNQDIMTPIDQGPKGGGSRVIHKMIRGSKLKIIKGCGHTFLFERPEESARIITAFINAHKK